MLSVSLLLTLAMPVIAVDPHVVTDCILVQVRPGVAPARLAETLAAWPVIALEPVIAPELIDDLARRYGVDRFYAVRVPPGTDTPAMVDELGQFAARLGDVSPVWSGEFLSEPPDAPDDPLFFPDQWALYNDGETPLSVPCPANCQDPENEFTPGDYDADIDGLEAWNLETGLPIVTVAVLDTGADQYHPDLADSWIRLDGSNFGEGDPDLPWTVISSHGTWVSGVIAASRNNGQVTAGISPGSMIVPIKLGNFTFNSVQAIQAVYFARLQPGVSIINMSWKTNPTPGLNAVLTLADAAGKLLVAAAGNSDDGGEPVTYPASHPAVMAVSGTDRFDELFSRSNSGPEVSVAAPGEAIVTTSILGAMNPQGCMMQNYCRRDGTSMAAAHVSGVAALVWSVAPGYFDNDAVRDIIESTAEDLGPPGFDYKFGHGRVNAYAAVCEAQRRVREELLGCPGDVNLDGSVDFNDILDLLAGWGQPAPGDLDCDQQIGLGDTQIVYDNWGPCAGTP